MYIREFFAWEEKIHTMIILNLHKIAIEILSSVKNEQKFILYHLAADKFEIVQKL